MCPSLNALSLAEEKQGCCNVSILKNVVFIWVTGLVYINEKLRFFHTPGKVSKGWLLCLSLHTHQMLQTNTHVCSRPFVHVRNCGSQSSSSGLFQVLMGNPQKVSPPSAFVEWGTAFKIYKFIFCLKVDRWETHFISDRNSNTFGVKWHYLYHM